MHDLEVGSGDAESLTSDFLKNLGEVPFGSCPKMWTSENKGFVPVSGVWGAKPPGGGWGASPPIPRSSETNVLLH